MAHIAGLLSLSKTTLILAGCLAVGIAVYFRRKYQESPEVNYNSRSNFDGNEINMCVICLQDLKGDTRTLKCKHKFHKNCIERVFEEQSKCPMCRQELLPKDRFVRNV